MAWRPALPKREPTWRWWPVTAKRPAGRSSEVRARGVRAVGVTADLRLDADVKRAVDEAVQSLGRVDILVNNAGTVVRKEPHEITAEEWDRVFDVNLRAAFLMAKEVYPHMKSRGGGKVINVGSMTSIFGGGRQRGGVLRQQGRDRPAIQEPRRGMGPGQHPVQRDPTRLVHDGAHIRHSRGPTRAVSTLSAGGYRPGAGAKPGSCRAPSCFCPAGPPTTLPGPSSPLTAATPCCEPPLPRRVGRRR